MIETLVGLIILSLMAVGLIVFVQLIYSSAVFGFSFLAVTIIGCAYLIGQALFN